MKEKILIWEIFRTDSIKGLVGMRSEKVNDKEKVDMT